MFLCSGAMIQISADILRTYAASDWPDGMSTAFGYVSSGGDLPFCSRVCVHVARGSFLYFSLSLFFSLFSSSLFSLHRYDWSKTHDDDGTELGGTCGTIAGPWLVTIELAMHEVSIRDLWRVAVFFIIYLICCGLSSSSRACVSITFCSSTHLWQAESNNRCDDYYSSCPLPTSSSERACVPDPVRLRLLLERFLLLIFGPTRSFFQSSTFLVSNIIVPGSRSFARIRRTTTARTSSVVTQIR